MGGHLGFTFHWPVSIPDKEIEFTGLIFFARGEETESLQKLSA